MQGRGATRGQAGEERVAVQGKQERQAGVGKDDLDTEVVANQGRGVPGRLMRTLSPTSITMRSWPISSGPR